MNENVGFPIMKLEGVYREAANDPLLENRGWPRAEEDADLPGGYDDSGERRDD